MEITPNAKRGNHVPGKDKFLLFISSRLKHHIRESAPWWRGQQDTMSNSNKEQNE